MTDIPPPYDVLVTNMSIDRGTLQRLCTLRDFLDGLAWQPSSCRQITGHHELTMLIRTLCSQPPATHGTVA